MVTISTLGPRADMHQGATYLLGILALVLALLNYGIFASRDTSSDPGLVYGTSKFVIANVCTLEVEYATSAYKATSTECDDYLCSNNPAECQAFNTMNGIDRLLFSEGRPMSYAMCNEDTNCWRAQGFAASALVLVIIGWWAAMGNYCALPVAHYLFSVVALAVLASWAFVIKLMDERAIKHRNSLFEAFNAQVDIDNEAHNALPAIIIATIIVLSLAHVYGHVRLIGDSYIKVVEY